MAKEPRTVQGATVRTPVITEWGGLSITAFAPDCIDCDVDGVNGG